MRQMFWGLIEYNGRSRLIAMDRDPRSRREGYTARSYVWALQEGLLPILKEDTIF